MKLSVPARFRPRSLVLATALLAAGVSAGAQTGRQAGAPDQLVQQVRMALGHGQVADARRLADSSTAAAASKDLASALVDIFEGKDAQARTKLEPLAADSAARRRRAWSSGCSSCGTAAATKASRSST